MLLALSIKVSPEIWIVRHSARGPELRVIRIVREVRGGWGLSPGGGGGGLRDKIKFYTCELYDVVRIVQNLSKARLIILSRLAITSSIWRSVPPLRFHPIILDHPVGSKTNPKMF